MQSLLNILEQMFGNNVQWLFSLLLFRKEVLFLTYIYIYITIIGAISVLSDSVGGYVIFHVPSSCLPSLQLHRFSERAFKPVAQVHGSLDRLPVQDCWTYSALCPG